MNRAVDLGGAQFDHVQEGPVEAAVAKVGFEGRPGFEAAGGDLLVIPFAVSN